MNRTAWLLLSKTDHEYGGNAGYDDVISERYLYDNSVPNHKNLKVGDLAVISDGDRLLGLARIDARHSATIRWVSRQVDSTLALFVTGRRLPVIETTPGVTGPSGRVPN